MTKLVTKVIVAVMTVLTFATVLASPVSASEGATCPNPVVVYGIEYCPKKTPFVIGNVVIDDATMLVMVILFGAIFAVVVNSMVVKSKLLAIR